MRSVVEREIGLRDDGSTTAPLPSLRAGRRSATDHRAKRHHQHCGLQRPLTGLCVCVCVYVWRGVDAYLFQD